MARINWDNIDQHPRHSGCWRWMGKVNGDHGGAARPNSSIAREMFMHTHGVKLTTKQYVLHTCDHPMCVNPAHLYLGDSRANQADRLARGRFYGGRGQPQPVYFLNDGYVWRFGVRLSNGRRPHIVRPNGTALCRVMFDDADTNGHPAHVIEACGACLAHANRNIPEVLTLGHSTVWL